MSEAGRIQSLKSLALLSHLSEAKLLEMTKLLKELRYKEGDVIFEEGSHGDSLYLLAHGQVRIEKKVVAGGYKELALLSPGDFFGEMALIEETPRSARAIGHGDVTLFILGRKELFDWLQSEPVMALGFFVELLRVFSQRLRHTSSELTLLYDVSHLILGDFGSEKVFLAEALRRVVPHLDGEWTASAYLFSPFNDEFERVASHGKAPEIAPDALAQPPASGWIGSLSFKAGLPGERGPMGYLVFTSQEEMSYRERDEAAITLTAVAHLLTSALQNIAHRSEEASRARLEKQTHGSVDL